jgi:hypothetical protein
MYIKGSKKSTPLHLYIRLFKRFQKEERGRLESRGVYNLIYRSLFYYYSNYSTSLPSIYSLCVLPFPLCLLPSMFPFLYMLPSLYILSFLYMLPLCAFLARFLLREGGEKEREK